MSDPVLAAWEALHAQGRMPEDSWPTDDMIRQIARLGFARPERSSVTCLDVGCGSGAMAWYLAKNGYDTYGVDGSASAIAHCEQRLEREGLPAHLAVGDVRALQYPTDFFHFCVESQCLMCLPWSDARKAIADIYRVTKPGGFFLSRTPSMACWGAGIGDVAGHNEWRDASEGPFAGMGLVRFVAGEQIEDLFAPFRVLAVEHSQTTVGNGAHTIAMWVVICKKEETL